MKTGSVSKKALKFLAFLLVIGVFLVSHFFNAHAPSKVEREDPETPVSLESFSGKVVGVMDGDTVEVMRKGKAARVRLHGVDCPEKKQPFGEKAKQFTSELVFGKEVRVEVKDYDKYGRWVGEVFLIDRSSPDAPQASLNAALVEAGMAWAYRNYSQQYVPQEEAARAAKRGLWSQAQPQSPWEFRHAGKTTKAAHDSEDAEQGN